MPSNYEKLSRPSGETNLTIPEKAATNATVTETPRISTTSTPQTDKLNPFDTDIEAMITTRTSDSCMHKTSSTPSPGRPTAKFGLEKITGSNRPRPQRQRTAAPAWPSLASAIDGSSRA
ncbi:hypothetical protein NW765_011679 [Fusarium oxysporum]|nr:hypothetical protein NW765_011679 [Fusarium oxysporum]